MAIKIRLAHAIRNMIAAEANMQLADTRLAKAERDESITSALHTSMLYLQKALLAAREKHDIRSRDK